MSSAVRTMPSLRAAQSFTASAVKQPVRRLHITGAKENPSQYLKPAIASSQPQIPKTESTRTFNTSRALKRPGDTSTIDFAFLPEDPSFAAGTVSTAALNIPILPDAYYRASAPIPEVPIPVANLAPEVQTVSMSMPGQVAVMSESDVGATHDGNAMDVYKLVETVSRNVKHAREKAESEVGIMREVVAGMFGDVVGSARRAL